MFYDFILPVSRTVVIIGSVFHCIQASYVQKTLKARDMMHMMSHNNLKDIETLCTFSATIFDYI